VGSTACVEARAVYLMCVAQCVPCVCVRGGRRRCVAGGMKEAWLVTRRKVVVMCAPSGRPGACRRKKADIGPACCTKRLDGILSQSMFYML
jgi:hypothetical protein